MGIFGSIFKAVTGPLRGIGHLAQGKFKKAIGAFGDTAKMAAPIIGATGVGLPLAAGIGALGGAASKWGEGESNVGKIFGSAATGAAGGAAGHLVSAKGPLSGAGGWLKTAAVGDPTTAAEGASKLGGVADWLSQNPEIALGAGQAGMQAYAGEQAGAMQDERFRLEQERDQYGREEDERRRRLEGLRMMMQSVGSFANV
jgi:hypothetical protein